jgi:voltage-gated sodium channel
MFMLQKRIGEFVEGQKAQTFIMALIILNAITLGLETVPEISQTYGDWLHVFDQIVLTIFVLEILAKMFYRNWRFFLNGWNIFDLVIIAIALMPASGALAVLRSLRILRALRLLSVVPSMRRVVQALLSAIPGIGSVGLLILLIFYVSAVISTKVFGPDFPQWFGSIGASMFTLFQVMTLESWAMGIVRPILELFPMAGIFFIPFILITSFTVLNLFIGIIVDAMQSQHMVDQTEMDRQLDTLNIHLDTQMETIHTDTVGLEQRLDGLMSEISDIKQILKGKRS